MEYIKRHAEASTLSTINEPDGYYCLLLCKPNNRFKVIKYRLIFFGSSNKLLIKSTFGKQSIIEISLFL